MFVAFKHCARPGPAASALYANELFTYDVIEFVRSCVVLVVLFFRPRDWSPSYYVGWCQLTQLRKCVARLIAVVSFLKYVGKIAIVRVAFLTSIS